MSSYPFPNSVQPPYVETAYGQTADTSLSLRDCDVCGFTFKAVELRKRWDGLMVCTPDFEEEHPYQVAVRNGLKLSNNSSLKDNS